MGRSRRHVVPEAGMAMDMLKAEIAQELGIEFDPSGYQGYKTSREMGLVGGHMTKRLVQLAEAQMSGTGLR